MRPIQKVQLKNGENILLPNFDENGQPTKYPHVGPKFYKVSESRNGLRNIKTDVNVQLNRVDLSSKMEDEDKSNINKYDSLVKIKNFKFFRRSNERRIPANTP
jgi:hypothetical protein